MAKRNLIVPAHDVCFCRLNCGRRRFGSLARSSLGFGCRHKQSGDAVDVLLRFGGTGVDFLLGGGQFGVQLIERCLR